MYIPRYLYAPSKVTIYFQGVVIFRYLGILCSLGKEEKEKDENKKGIYLTMLRCMYNTANNPNSHCRYFIKIR
jgi:hypothetical protein